MLYTLTADCIFPVYQLSDYERIEEVEIDTSGKIKIIKGELVQVQINGLISPYAMKNKAIQEKSFKNVKVKKFIWAAEYENKQIEIVKSVAVIEDFISWLSLITLEEYRIVNWGEIHSEPLLNKDSSTNISVGRKFNLPIDSFPIDESGEILQTYSFVNQKRINDFEKWITTELPEEIRSALRWYRKGLISYFPEEKLIFWVTSLEIISGMISEDTEIENECKVCGNVTRSRPSVNKKALFDFINVLGFSKNKTFNIIQKFRSKYAHGGNENFEYFNADINKVVLGTKALLILFISHYLELNGVFKPENEKHWLAVHPIYGDVSFLINDIKSLASSRL